MRIIIGGIGKVGWFLAKELSSLGHEVTAIDANEELISEINQTMEVRGVVGDIANPATLKRAEIYNADIAIANSNHDADNILFCVLAKELFSVPRRIAIIRDNEFHKEEWASLFGKGALDIPRPIDSDRLLADAIFNRLQLKEALYLGNMASGRLVLASYHIPPESNILAYKLEGFISALGKLGGILLGVVRGGNFMPVVGISKLSRADEVHLILPRELAGELETLLGSGEAHKRRNKHFLFTNCGAVGKELVERIAAEVEGAEIKIVEPDRKTAETLAAELSDVTVLHGSLIDQYIQDEVNLDEVDSLICLSKDDNANLVNALVASHSACKSIMALTSNGFRFLPRMANNFQMVNYVEVIAGHILENVFDPNVIKIGTFGKNYCHLYEINVPELSPHNLSQFIGSQVKEEKAALVGVWRNGEFLAPFDLQTLSGNDNIIMLVSHKEVIEGMADIFNYIREGQ